MKDLTGPFTTSTTGSISATDLAAIPSPAQRVSPIALLASDRDSRMPRAVHAVKDLFGQTLLP